jgi:hypothetical protein
MKATSAWRTYWPCSPGSKMIDKYCDETQLDIRCNHGSAICWWFTQTSDWWHYGLWDYFHLISRRCKRFYVTKTVVFLSIPQGLPPFQSNSTATCVILCSSCLNVKLCEGWLVCSSVPNNPVFCMGLGLFLIISPPWANSKANRTLFNI